MKTAARVLVIIAIVIGFIWGIVGFFGSAFLAGCETALAEKEEEVAIEEYENVGVNAAIAFFVIIAATVFGIVASREKSGKATTIVNSLILLGCGIAATALQSWIAGPLFIISAVLAFLGGVMKRKETT